MAKTLKEGFDMFISWLVPLSTEHEIAKKHKDSVYSCMYNNFKCYKLFETGSFGNNTSVRHYSDIDYFAVCPTEELWDNSTYTLDRVKVALKSTFSRTSGIGISTPAVQIPFGKYTSENLEVTPCTFYGLVETPVGKKTAYYIANVEGGWFKASPTAHNAYVDRENERLGGKLKPLIQLVKAWKFYNNVPITSFYIELRVTKYAESEDSIVYHIDLKRIIKSLLNINLASIIDPMGISGLISACSTDTKKTESISKLNTAFTRASKAVELGNIDLDKAFYWWDMFFNNEFPSR